jgi:hypothetical protein
MLQCQAVGYIHDLRANIARVGYDQSDKRHLAVLFNDLRYLYSDTH